MNPPTVACVIAITLGLINNGLLPEDTPRDWLRPIATAAEYGAVALVPIIQISLGAKLYDTVMKVRD